MIDIVSSLWSVFPWLILKIMILLILLMYIVFAAVIVRQEQLMSRVVAISFLPILRLIGIGHLIAAISLFFLTLVLL